jgi:hypothetical protein
MSLEADIYTQLKDDHTAVASVLRQLTATDATDTVQRQALLAELKHHLTRHSDAEHEVFYARLLQHEHIRPLIRDGQHEHQRIETLLDELERMAPNAPLWGARLQTLKDTVEHHIHEEEGPIFAQAQHILTAQQAEELGRQFEHAKTRQTPTGAKVTAASYDREATATGRETRERVAHEAQYFAEEAKAKGRSLLREQQHVFATQLGGFAAALRQTAQHLGTQDQQTVAHYTDQAAAGLERLSQNMQDQDFSTLLGQVEDFARRQPVAFVGSAAIVGFLTARFLKSSAERRQPSPPPPSYDQSSHPGDAGAGSSPDIAAQPPAPSPTGVPASGSGSESTIPCGGQ